MFVRPDDIDVKSKSHPGSQISPYSQCQQTFPVHSRSCCNDVFSRIVLRRMVPFGENKGFSFPPVMQPCVWWRWRRWELSGLGGACGCGCGWVGRSCEAGLLKKKKGGCAFKTQVRRFGSLVRLLRDLGCTTATFKITQRSCCCTSDKKGKKKKKHS